MCRRRVVPDHAVKRAADPHPRADGHGALRAERAVRIPGIRGQLAECIAERRAERRAPSRARGDLRRAAQRGAERLAPSRALRPRGRVGAAGPAWATTEPRDAATRVRLLAHTTDYTLTWPTARSGCSQGVPGDPEHRSRRSSETGSNQAVLTPDFFSAKRGFIGPTKADN